MKRLGMAAFLIVGMVSTLSAQEVRADALPIPNGALPLVISLDTTMMVIDNPTPESYVVEMFFFFWDEIKDRHTIKATDVRLKANGTTTIQLKRFGSIFSVDRTDPLPRTVAFTLRDTHDIYAICMFRKTDDGDLYVLEKQQSAFLSESMQDIPSYRPQDRSWRRH